MQTESLPVVPQPASHGDEAASIPPVGALSKEAFQEMLAAAERVNRHHMSGSSSKPN
jgi:hypothetical protein